MPVRVNLLLLDDLLRLHDAILPVYLGITGDFIGDVYVLLILLYLFRFRTPMLQYPYIFLVMALELCGISVAIDIAPKVLKDLFSVADVIFVEDGAKLRGIANWLAYFACLSASIISKRNLAAPKPTVDDWAPGTRLDRLVKAV